MNKMKWMNVLLMIMCLQWGMKLIKDGGFESEI